MTNLLSQMIENALTFYHLWLIMNSSSNQATKNRPIKTITLARNCGSSRFLIAYLIWINFITND